MIVYFMLHSFNITFDSYCILPRQKLIQQIFNSHFDTIIIMFQQISTIYTFHNLFFIPSPKNSTNHGTKLKLAHNSSSKC